MLRHIDPTVTTIVAAAVLALSIGTTLNTLAGKYGPELQAVGSANAQTLAAPPLRSGPHPPPAASNPSRVRFTFRAKFPAASSRFWPPPTTRRRPATFSFASTTRKSTPKSQPPAPK